MTTNTRNTAPALEIENADKAVRAVILNRRPGPIRKVSGVDPLECELGAVIRGLVTFHGDLDRRAYLSRPGCVLTPTVGSNDTGVSLDITYGLVTGGGRLNGLLTCHRDRIDPVLSL